MTTASDHFLRRRLMPGSRSSLLCVLIAISTASGAVPGQSIAEAGPAVGAEHSDAALPEVRRPLPFFYDVYTFRGSGDSTAIVGSFAVEAGYLETEPVSSRTRYRFSVTLVLADTALRTVSITHDTVFVDMPRALPGDHLLYTHVELPAPPSGAIQKRVIMTDATAPGIGQLYTQMFPIPSYSGTHLMISDIALGQPDAITGWERGDVTLALLPTTQFPSSAFDVYYEVYNLPAGTPYSTEIAIEHIQEGRAASERQPVRLSFRGESAAGPDGALPELRRVEASLPKGSYRITATIMNLETGESASRSRSFQVRGWGRGTMMVPALPQTAMAR